MKNARKRVGTAVTLLFMVIAMLIVGLIWDNHYKIGRLTIRVDANQLQIGVNAGKIEAIIERLSPP